MATASSTRSSSCTPVPAPRKPATRAQRTLYDRKLPGEGLLVYHVDEAIDGNDDENHPFIKLLEADGLNQLRDGANRGDAGDPYPGRSKNVALTHASNPNAKSYGNVNTCVTVTNISATGASMKVRLGVKCSGGSAPTPSAARTSVALPLRGRKRYKSESAPAPNAARTSLTGTAPRAADKPVAHGRRRSSRGRRRSRARLDVGRADASAPAYRRRGDRVQIAENWSRIRGRVEAWQPPRKAGDPGTLTIVVERVDDVVARWITSPQSAG